MTRVMLACLFGGFLVFIQRIYSALKTNGIGKILNWAINKYEFKRKMLLLHSYPISVDIETTNKCLLRCIHCPRTYCNINETGMELGFLSVEKFSEIIDKLRSVRRIILNGLGEPLLNPGIFKMVEFAHKKSFFVSFSTAASFFSAEIEAGLRNHPPDLLNFSVDSGEKTSFEAIRCNHNFEKFMTNLQEIITAVCKSGNNVEMQFHCCAMKLNAPYLTTVVELADRMKIKSISFSGLNFSYLQSVMDKLVLAEEDLVNVKEAIRVAARKGIQATFNRYHGIKTPGKVLCWYLWQQPYITWDGYVNICCGRPFSSLYSVGNIFKANSFMEILNSPQMQALRQAIRTGNVPPVCSACPLAE
ncbi:MAG: radical SAM protein [Candidatus Omnitrophica bacterium]|nr:radical SAM protein [Candidatus Omnitrophota bacterium]